MSSSTAPVVLLLLLSLAPSGAAVAETRGTVDPETLPDLAPAEFSTVVEADRSIFVDRKMMWDASHYGSHAETAVASPALTWYLAEGATHSGFQLFYLLQNATDVTATIQVTYLLPSPASPIVTAYCSSTTTRCRIRSCFPTAKLHRSGRFPPERSADPPPFWSASRAW